MAADLLTADVVVIGAGLSGLTTARRLVQAGADVVVVEARGRIGGRLHRHVRPDGRSLERGGELLAPHMTSVAALAEEVGLELVPLPERAGRLVRYTGEQRVLESELFDTDAAAAAAYAAAVVRLDLMAAEVPLVEPWTAARAAEWDAQTLEQWLAAHVPSSAARAGLALEFDFSGGTPSELSLLYMLWTIRSMGGWEQWSRSATHRIPEGTSELVARIASGLGDRIVLDAPVRSVAQHADRVIVATDDHEIAAQVVVAALAPQLCARIEFTPGLPPSRDRLQDRYLQGHGVKLVAVYDRPWWRDAGLSGMGTGLAPLFLTVDVSDGSGEGMLLGFVAVTGAIAGTDELSAAGDRDVLLAQLCRYLGPEAVAFKELHVFNWIGDHWSMGCAAGLPPGVLTTVGHALRAPIGRIVWAGAETGLPQNDWIEGAVSAGERAAREALDLLA